MKVMKRQEALSKNLDFYFTGKPCKHGHISKRIARNSTCIACARISSKKWKQSPENIDHYNLYQQSYSGHNLHFIRKYLEDPDEVLFDKRYRKRKRLKDATPDWAGHAAIRHIYNECVRQSSELNMELEIDHVIPIFNKNVCGLHISENLRVVSHNLNTLKGNKFNQDVASAELLKWLKERNL